jgi:DNA-binding response OmpR family regulator
MDKKSLADYEKKPKILLLEDYTDLIAFYSGKLSEAGFSVVVETDEEYGIDAAKREKPDLIILDISLPHHHDLWFIEEKKKHPETAAIPVVILTDLSAAEDVKAGLAAGAAEYLIRDNFTFAEIIAKIKEIINKQKSR